ncbi:MAG: MG2 domain-containing protein [Anaerolineae bacterium]
MSPKLSVYTPTILKVALLLLLALAFAAFAAVAGLPNRADAQQTLIIGPSRFAPGSDAALRVVVQRVGGGDPVSGAEVKVSLKPESGRAVTLFEGATAADGSVPVSFHVPPDVAGEQTLVVESKSSAGRDRAEQPVTIKRDYRLLLSTDKPLYQPGQTIHLRALALSLFDLAPARGAAVDFLVEDPRGNKVFRQTVPASEFGVAAIDFTLADMVNQGNYKLSAAIGDTASEKTVEVRPYALPKFGVTVTTDRPFYTPGARVEGTVQAGYFYGKPVAGGEVRLLGVVYDVQRVEAVDISGQTDDDGAFHFSFDLPDYFVASGLDAGQARFGLEVTVIDRADHPEQTSRVIPVAQQPIIIEAVAESGQIRPGVENIIYLLTAYPDGTPAPTGLELRLNGGPPQTLPTGDYGLAEFRFEAGPDDTFAALSVTARDAQGFSAHRQFDFEAERGQDHVLLRADRAAYLVGETMNLTALSPVNFGSVYLDIVKDGQTLSTRSAPLANGKAKFAVDLGPDLYGTLELHAYKVLPEGSLVRDSRVVVVDQPRDLSIAISADRDTYLPGDPATIDFRTTAQADGSPVQTALGVAIVDESVFALQQQDPGFAKLYFMLEAELLEPFYQIKGFELPAAYAPDEAPLRQAQDAGARAAWANAPTQGLAMQVNTRPEKMQALQRRQEKGFERLGAGALWGMILIPLLVWGIVVWATRRAGVVKRSLIGLAKASGLLLLVLAALWGVLAFLDSMRWRFDSLNWVDVEEIALFGIGGPAALAFVVALIGLPIYAWRRRDEAAKFILLLTAGWGALLFLLILVTDEGPTPPKTLLVLAILGLALLPGAYLLYGQKLLATGRRGPGWLASILGGATAFPALAGVFAVLMIGGGFGPMGRAASTTEFVVEEAMAVPAAQMVDRELAKTEAEAPAEAGSAEAPRLRQFFPETLYWNPELLTDETGAAQLTLPMADSITTWRLTALASSQDGRLGFATQGIRVFQDFFVDVDLPVSLTQGDEISIPVGVFNYLPEAQQVRLVVEPESWFDLLGPAEQTLTIASNDIEVVYFPIRAREFGQKGFQVTAWGQKMSDAVRRQVRVLPDGKEIRLTESNWLRQNTEIALNLPPEVIPRTAAVEVKIYPGVLAQVVEGLEKIPQLPHG